LSTSGRAERERKHFDDLAERQPEAWWGHLAPAGRWRSQQRAKHILTHAQIESRQRVLEVGCAAGFFTSNYIGRILPDVRVVAVDISPGMIRRAKGKPEFRNYPNLSFEVGDIGRLPYDDDDFDAVIGSSILHHLDLPRCLPELHRVLKPGGRFVFAEPNALNPLVLWEMRRKTADEVAQASEDEAPINRFRLARQLRAYGFSVDRIKPFDFLHPKTPRCLLRIVSGLGRVLDALPLIREIAGSVLIVARKPSVGS